MIYKSIYKKLYMLNPFFKKCGYFILNLKSIQTDIS